MRALLFGALLAVSGPAFAQTWEPVTDEDGVKVWQRPVVNSSLVEFRGRGIVDASLRQVLAVLADAERKTEWMANCAENRVVRAKSVGDRVVYNRIGSSWPLVSDRDVVVQTSFTAWPEKRQVVVEAWNTEDKLAPELDGVVRMPELQLRWTLVVVDEDRTDVTYQVRADPGGSLPHWAVNLISKHIPLNTIRNLRKQVTKDYSSALALIDRAYDWSKVEGILAAAPHALSP
ncbi:MAG: hypothetical protein HY791_15070 [Deltaproteobacteria bacterium]|nr:hypothetical protein [Deltaproteobacteria bacterium]